MGQACKLKIRSNQREASGNQSQKRESTYWAAAGTAGSMVFSLSWPASFTAETAK
jgi:hypothetical protein